MVSIQIEKIPVAIPTIDLSFEYFKNLESHPDILFEYPINLNIFSKLLIYSLRTKYPGCGINSEKLNSISLGEYDENDIYSNFFEPLFCLKPMLYYDIERKKIFAAFDTYNIADLDKIFVAEIIKNLTKKNVYLNLCGKKYPYFETLVTRYDLSKLFGNYTNEDKLYYKKKKFVDNIQQILNILINYVVVNNLADMVEV